MNYKELRVEYKSINYLLCGIMSHLTTKYYDEYCVAATIFSYPVKDGNR